MAGDPFTAAIFRWLSAVVADAELPPAAFKLAYVISQHINRNSKEAWPSQETLATAINVKDDRSVRRLTEALERRGHLVTRRRKHLSMVYRLAQDRTELSYQEEQTQTGIDARADIPVRSTGQDRTFESARPDISSPQDRTELSAKPLKEPLKNHEGVGRARATLIPDDFRFSEETYQFALDRLGSADAVDRSLERFKNHHLQVDGRTAYSRDWQAKARNWIDDDAKKKPAKSLSATAQSLIDRGVAFGPRPVPPSELLALGPFGEEILKRIGADSLRSWFVGKVTLAAVGQNGVTLTASSNFIRDTIREKFEAEVLAAVRSVNPAVAGLAFAVKRSAA